LIATVHAFASIGWACLAAVLVSFAGCAPPEAGMRAATGTQASIAVVTAAAVVEPMGIEIEAVGTTQANESVEVTSKASNVITAIRFAEGAEVSRGDVLLELDAAEARAALAEAQAALADSRSQYERSRELLASQVISIAQLEQIEAALNGNRARVAAAEARLGDMVIRAPFDGRTGFRRVSVGSFVSPGSVITTLDDISRIKLDFTVPETHLFLLRRGLPVKASTTGLPGRAFEGEVTNLESRVDPVTRSITVRAELSNDDGLLRAGMFMTVMLQGDVRPTLLVPEESIVPEQGRIYVFVVRGDRAERREVRIGKRRPGEVEVVEGIEEGDRVVVEGTQNLRHGAIVQEAARRPT
jgi:membrane fusion protein, multidrug efflux system